MSINRRQFVKLSSLLALSSSAQPLLASTGNSPERKLSMLNLHTGERICSTYWADGEYQMDELIRLNSLLRDHRANQTTHMDPLLLDQVHRLQQTMGHTGEVHIISGYRSPATNEKLRQMGHKTAKKSLHMQGRAIDIRLPKQNLAQVRKAALNLKAGGVGYYPSSNFIHLDTGKLRQWG